jgi:hypothetical protein
VEKFQSDHSAVAFEAAAAASVTCVVHYAKGIDIVLCMAENFLEERQLVFGLVRALKSWSDFTFR